MNTPNKAKKPTYMIDTVVLKLTFPDFRVLAPQLFTPALNIVETEASYDYLQAIQAYGRKNYTTYTQNMTAQDKENRTYKPQLTVYKRFKETKYVYDLHIQFSVPKLIFNNSIQELGEENFEGVVILLKRKLSLMGIETTEEKIKHAVVRIAHFAKNIPLPFPLTVQDAISSLCKADMGRGKDINIREFRNGGQALYFYATSYNIIFYDKLKDITMAKNKATDKDRLYGEKKLIKITSEEKKEEILRFEVRFANTAKLRSLFSYITKTEKTGNILFEDIFKKELCKKALLKVWEEIVNVPINQLALKLTNTPEEAFNEFIKRVKINSEDGAHSLKSTLTKFALYMLVSNKGVRWTRDKIEKTWTERSWGRLLRNEIKDSVDILKGVPDSNSVGTIKSALDKFEKYDWKIDS